LVYVLVVAAEGLDILGGGCERSKVDMW